MLQTRAHPDRTGRLDALSSPNFSPACARSRNRHRRVNGMGGLACTLIAKPTRPRFLPTRPSRQRHVNHCTHADVMNDLIVMAFRRRHRVNHLHSRTSARVHLKHVHQANVPETGKIHEPRTCPEYHGAASSSQMIFRHTGGTAQSRRSAPSSTQSKNSLRIILDNCVTCLRRHALQQPRLRPAASSLIGGGSGS